MNFAVVISAAKVTKLVFRHIFTPVHKRSGDYFFEIVCYKNEYYSSNIADDH